MLKRRKGSLDRQYEHRHQFLIDRWLAFFKNNDMFIFRIGDGIEVARIDLMLASIQRIFLQG